MAVCTEYYAQRCKRCVQSPPVLAEATWIAGCADDVCFCAQGVWWDFSVAITLGELTSNPQLRPCNPVCVCCLVGLR